MIDTYQNAYLWQLHGGFIVPYSVLQQLSGEILGWLYVPPVSVFVKRIEKCSKRVDGNIRFVLNTPDN